ncbi:hypothetical protein KP509_24G032900 [Ceratopteris richardii]|uniref:WRKY domain-containing protein n=1 Tax=Ceratopteris richardii TaxID=49495 RepID=A0A8T2RTK8_CERRI|nr:hypothetical protein KP509_24G032900 [Ceratopteris richardii]
MDIRQAFASVCETGNIARDRCIPALQVGGNFCQCKNHGETNNSEYMYAPDGLLRTVWETPNWNELEASAFDSGLCTNFPDFNESCWRGSELSEVSSDTSHVAKIEAVNQHNAVTGTENGTENNLWKSVNNHHMDIRADSSIKENDALVSDCSSGGSEVLGRWPVISNTKIRTDYLKPKATNIMKKKRFNVDSNHERTDEESVEFIVKSTTAQICDGYSWLKYGQKNIKHMIHPRSYFNCASPNCNVKKQTELSSEMEGRVSITYFGRHNHLPPNPCALKGRRPLS